MFKFFLGIFVLKLVFLYTIVELQKIIYIISKLPYKHISTKEFVHLGKLVGVYCCFE